MTRWLPPTLGRSSVMLLRRLNASFESVELTTTPSSLLRSAWTGQKWSSLSSSSQTSRSPNVMIPKHHLVSRSSVYVLWSVPDFMYKFTSYHFDTSLNSITTTTTSTVMLTAARSVLKPNTICILNWAACTSNLKPAGSPHWQTFTIFETPVYAATILPLST